MILVSQDKTELINLNEIENIWICSDEEGRITIEATADTNSTLGYYKNVERAKEILYDITKAYCFYKGKPHTWGDIQELLGKYEYGVYEMPKE